MNSANIVDAFLTFGRLKSLEFINPYKFNEFRDGDTTCQTPIYRFPNVPNVVDTECKQF